MSQGTTLRIFGSPTEFGQCLDVVRFRATGFPPLSFCTASTIVALIRVAFACSLLDAIFRSSDFYSFGVACSVSHKVSLQVHYSLLLSAQIDSTRTSLAPKVFLHLSTRKKLRFGLFQVS